VLVTAAALTTLAGAACCAGQLRDPGLWLRNGCARHDHVRAALELGNPGHNPARRRFLPTQHAVHETLEITHGWTSWFETGFYIFTSVQTLGPDEGYWWVGSHIRPRVRVPEEWHLPVGLSLSLEVGYQQREFSPDTWTLEIRPIMDKQWGRWYFAINPAFDQSLKGPGTKTGIEFTPAAKVSYDLTKVVSPGVEYYGTLGPVGNFRPTSQQQHQLYAVVDLNLDPRWEINFGVGVGPTRTTDGLIIKMILGRRF